MQAKSKNPATPAEALTGTNKLKISMNEIDETKLATMKLIATNKNLAPAQVIKAPKAMQMAPKYGPSAFIITLSGNFNATHPYLPS